MRTYQLYIRLENAWTWVCTIDAATHAEAFDMALPCLPSRDSDSPIRIEEDTEGAFRKPCPVRCNTNEAVVSQAGMLTVNEMEL